MKKLFLVLLSSLLGYMTAGQVYADVKYVTNVRPIVQGLSCPSVFDSVKDEGPYAYSVKVTGGKPPYTYTWTAGNTVISGTGESYASVTLNHAQVAQDETPLGNFFMGVSVKDASGTDAEWTDDPNWMQRKSAGGSISFTCLVPSAQAVKSGSGPTTLEFQPTYPYYDMPVAEQVTPPSTVPSESQPVVTLPPNPCVGIPEGDAGARFTSISREVEFRRDCAKNAWNPAKMDTVLHVDDHVRTSEDSSAIIGFSDLSTFLLKADSEIVITTPPANDSKLKLVLGNIWVNVKKMAHNGTMEIDMSQAVAGIKGTTFVLSDDGKNSTLKVIEGTVTFTSKADGKITLVSMGEMMTVDKNGSQPKQKFDVAGETKLWDAVRAAQGLVPNNVIWYGAGAVVIILLSIVGYLKFVRRK